MLKIFHRGAFFEVLTFSEKNFFITPHTDISRHYNIPTWVWNQFSSTVKVSFLQILDWNFFSWISNSDSAKSDHMTIKLTRLVWNGRQKLLCMNRCKCWHIKNVAHLFLIRTFKTATIFFDSLLISFQLNETIEKLLVRNSDGARIMGLYYVEMKIQN